MCTACLYLYYIDGRRGLKKGAGSAVFTPLPVDLRGIELRTADRPSPLPTHTTHFKHFNSGRRARRSEPEACASAIVTVKRRRIEAVRKKKRERFWYRCPWVAQTGGRKKDQWSSTTRGEGRIAFSISHDFLPFWPEPLCAYVFVCVEKKPPLQFQSVLSPRMAIGVDNTWDISRFIGNSFFYESVAKKCVEFEHLLLVQDEVPLQENIEF